MQIFILDANPRRSAKYHCDKATKDWFKYEYSDEPEWLFKTVK